MPRILTIVFLFLSLFLFLIENKKSAFALLQQHHQGTSRSLSRHRLSQIQAYSLYVHPPQGKYPLYLLYFILFCSSSLSFLVSAGKTRKQREFFEGYAKENKFDPLDPTKWYKQSIDKILTTKVPTNSILNYMYYFLIYIFFFIDDCCSFVNFIQGSETCAGRPT